MHREQLLEGAKTPVQRIKERYDAISKIRQSQSLTYEEKAEAVAKIGDGVHPQGVLEEYGLI